MFLKLIKIAGSLMLVVFIIGTLAFTSFESSEIVCNKIEIKLDDDDLISINNEELIRLIKTVDKEIINKKLSQINTESIEQAIEKHQAILNAEVYKVIAKDTGSLCGVLGVKVKHREPIVRLMSASGSYYLDEFGGKIPTSSNYSANVLVTTGYFSEKYAKEELLPFILFIESEKFWKAQIEQVHIEASGNVLLIPLVGEHVVEFGKLEDYQKKLKKLKAFYTQVLVKNNWNKYKTISLKYNNQVIAKRR